MRIRAKIRENELEIEASKDEFKAALDFIPEIIARFPPIPTTERPTLAAPVVSGSSPPAHGPESRIPEIRLEKDDSLSDTITKLFKDPWGRTPKRLSDVREALESYGQVYPKQSVAVALLRLAQSGRLRRFKGETGEFVYTASTGLLVEGASEQESVKSEAPI